MHVIDLFTRELPIYLMCLAGAHALVFFKRDQEQSERLVRARLDALQMQLQPHFLFNSLNAIASLIPTHPAKAENLVEALSDLLRHRLNDAEAHEVPLAEEISFLRRYLELMHARFEERLRYHIDSPAELDDALVPSMLLQPLVENAIEHGLRPKSGGGTVEVRASRVEGSNLLRLDIIDDGVGMNPDRPMEENIGLGNTRARLHDLYGSGSSLILQSGPGTTVSVTLPLHFR